MRSLIFIILFAPVIALADYIVYHPGTDTFDTGRVRADVPASLVDGYVVLEVLEGSKPTPSVTENVVEVDAPCVSNYPALTCTKQWVLAAKPQSQLDREQCTNDLANRRQQARIAIADLNSRIGNLTNANALDALNRVMINQRAIIRILVGDPSESC